MSACLAELPADRRATFAAVRRVMKRHLPAGYREVMRWGMISYEVPLRRYPDTCNGRPLLYAALAAQKGYSALYLTFVNQDPTLATRLKRGFQAAGKTLHMGKSCIRFQRPEDLPLPLIGRIIRGPPVPRFLARAESARVRRRAIV